MHELMFQAGVKGMSSLRSLIPCTLLHKQGNIFVVVYIIVWSADYIIIILILQLCVCESGRSREVHSSRAKQFSLSSSLDLDVTRGSPLTQLAMALVAN